MNEFLNACLQIGSLAVLVVGSWAVAKLSGWLGLKQDSEVRSYLQDALGIAVDAGYRRLELARVGATPDQVAALRAQIIGETATYVASKVPDALKHLGINDAGLRDMIEARLPPLVAALPAAVARG